MKHQIVIVYRLTIFLVCLTVILLAINLLKKEDEKIKKEKLEKEEFTEWEEKNEIEYKANETIRVKFSKTGEVVAMDMNDYLRGVVPSEMPPSYNIEALKTQALVARTYTYRKIAEHGEGSDADICDSSAHCQAFYPKEKLFEIWRNRGFTDDMIKEYWSKVNEAVVSTQNQIITYNNEPIKAFFHASSPIKTESVDQIWGGVSIPYLQAVENVEAEDYANRTSEVWLTYDELLNKFLESGYDVCLDDIKQICVCDYTTSGRVKNIQIGNTKVSAEKMRTLFSLKSTMFNITKDEKNVCFHVTGYGHGIGMSQVGANYLASQNKKYDEIIKYYYTGVEIKTLKN